MNLQPTKLELQEGNRLRIECSDGQSHSIPFGTRRSRCPCATCREQRAAPPQPTGGLQVISKAEAQPLKVLGMRPVGNYAYAIAFSDGHDTGIFTLEFLRELGADASD